MASLKELPLADIAEEIAITRRVLERVPEESLAWKPHDKSKSLGELAAHIADVVGLQVLVITEDEVDVAASPPQGAGSESKDEIIRAFDANAAKLRSALENVDESALTRDWTFRFGEHVIFTRPRLVTLRTFGIGHIAHHRGQLTVYLRMLDVPLPAVYGPTADER